FFTNEKFQRLYTGCEPATRTIKITIVYDQNFLHHHYHLRFSQITLHVIHSSNHSLPRVLLQSSFAYYLG
ncbi:hypothetical protein L9F63_026636, partial [Diploptera punctata]